MIKLLIGGSPCTHWSIAKSKNRETRAEGIGWELFKNYVIAKEKFKPDFFLYENNWSASKEIKKQIQEELGCELMRINSNLVSAQNRDRFYVFNWEVEQPEDRGILLKDILESGEDLTSNNKSYCLTSSYGGACEWNTIERKQRSMVAERVNTVKSYNIPENCDLVITDNSIRCQRRDKKHSSVQGTHVNFLHAKSQTLSVAHVPKVIELSDKAVYEVKDGMITIKNKIYPIKLKDGYYIIRKLTPVECERLQTMPDGYTAAVSNTQRYKGLGNGWTAEVIIHILDGALKDIPKDEKILVLSMYDGIGTGRYCLDKIGFTNVEYHAYEIDKYAIKVAMSNYPDIIQHGDAFQVRESEVLI